MLFSSHLPAAFRQETRAEETRQCLLCGQTQPKSQAKEGSQASMLPPRQRFLGISCGQQSLQELEPPGGTAWHKGLGPELTAEEMTLILALLGSLVHFPTTVAGMPEP